MTHIDMAELDMKELSNERVNGKYQDADSNLKGIGQKPSKQNIHIKPFSKGNRYSRYRYLATNERSYFTNRLHSLPGSSQNLLDPSKLMTLQDDAKSKKISTEVMKNRLYESVVFSPRKRRMSVKTEYLFVDTQGSQGLSSISQVARMVQSLPVTPAQSHNVSPVQSPVLSRSHYGFFSRGATPHSLTPEERPLAVVQEDGGKGIASIFQPQPSYISASQLLSKGECSIDEGEKTIIEN